MVRLIHDNKVILENMKYAESILDIGRGLMFANQKKVKRGMCLVFPSKKNKKFACSVTMLFCFYSYDIIFLDKDFKVVDKALLKPFRLSYIPKKSCKYVIESWKGTFDNVKIGDFVKIKK